MELQIFVDNFIKAIEIEDASLVQDTTVFRKLDEWDSLAALSTISMVDDEYGVTITNKDLKTVKTIEELYNLVASKK